MSGPKTGIRSREMDEEVIVEFLSGNRMRMVCNF
jgi:hypothetical protein